MKTTPEERATLRAEARNLVLELDSVHEGYVGTSPRTEEVTKLLDDVETLTAENERLKSERALLMVAAGRAIIFAAALGMHPKKEHLAELFSELTDAHMDMIRQGVDPLKESATPEASDD